MEGNNYSNVLLISARTHTRTNIKNIYIIVILIVVINDKKNQRFYNIQIGSYNYDRNNEQLCKVTYNCFIYFLSLINYYIFDNY